MKDDLAQEMYARRAKPLLRKTEPFAAIAILCALAPIVTVSFVPLSIAYGGALAILFGIVSLIRLSKSAEYQGKAVANAAVAIGVLEVIGTIIALALLK